MKIMGNADSPPNVLYASNQAPQWQPHQQCTDFLTDPSSSEEVEQKSQGNQQQYDLNKSVPLLSHLDVKQAVSEL